MTKEAAVAMTRMQVDNQIYNNMMSRNLNFRFKDLSSVFKTPNKLRYFRRLFDSGDESVPGKIEDTKPILNLTTHDLIQVGGTIFEALGHRLTFINMVRHPLFMLVQQTLNMERLLDNPRDIQIYFEHDGLSVPYFAQGWEELFIKSNSVERAIYSIYYQGKKRVQFLSANDYLKNHKFIEIPFELFVKNPENFMRIICQFLDTRYSNLTEREMKRQKFLVKILWMVFHLTYTSVADGNPLKVVYLSRTNLISAEIMQWPTGRAVRVYQLLIN